MKTLLGAASPHSLGSRQPVMNDGWATWLRQNRSGILNGFLIVVSLLLLGVTAITMQFDSLDEFLSQASWPVFFLAVFLLLTPLIFSRKIDLLFIAILFPGILYCLFEVSFLGDGSKLFGGDTTGYHFLNFWYFANSISFGFGMPEWFPADGGIPVGPLSISLLFTMPHRLLGYLLYAILPLKPIFAFYLQMVLGMVLAGVGWWCVLHRLTGCRWSAVFGTLMVLLGGVGLTLHHEQVIATITWLPWILLCLFHIQKHAGVFFILMVLVGFSLATHQPQIQLITLLAVFGFLFIFPRSGWSALKTFVLSRNRLHWVIALPLLLLAASPVIYLNEVKGEFTSDLRTDNTRSTGKLGSESWEEYEQLNRQQNSSASLNSFLQFISPDYSLDNDRFLFFVSRIGLIFAVLSLFYRHPLRIPIWLCTGFLGLCALGINGPVPRVLFELRFPFIHYFRQWYHFGPMFLLGISALAAMGFCFALKSVERKFPQFHRNFFILCIAVILFELLVYGARYNKKAMVTYGEPWSRIERQAFLEILTISPSNPNVYSFVNKLRGSTATKIINFKTRKMLGPLFVNRQPYFAKAGLSVMGLSSEEQLVKVKRLFIEKGPFSPISIVDAPQEVLAGMAGNKNANSLPPVLNLDKKIEEGVSSAVITPKGARLTVRAIETVLMITPFNTGNRFRGFLDGEEVPVWSANVNMAAIILPPGVHNLELKVHDRPFNFCLIVQGLLLTAILLGTLALSLGGISSRFGLNHSQKSVDKLDEPDLIDPS